MLSALRGQCWAGLTLVTAGASSARGSSQLAPPPPPDPAARLLPLQAKAGKGRENEWKAREKGLGEGMQSWRGGKRSLSGGRCSQQPELLQGCSREAALLRALNTQE